MKPKTMILMGLAITCGLGASYMTSRLLAERTPDEPEKVEILVASKNLNVHQRLVNPEEMFEKKAIAKESAPTDAITDFEQLKGKTLKQGRNKGDHITPANLYEKGQLEIPEGKQAVGIRVNIETTASGLASLPGSHVDLLLTIRGPDLPSTKALILLESVLVLAADIRVTPEGEIAAPAQVVTFGLKPEDVLIVTAAKEMGTITLVLRKKEDNSVALIRSMTGKKILDPHKAPEFTPTPPPVVVATKEVEKPKEPEKPKVVTPELPKVVHSHYDIVNGSVSGPREVTRVHYAQAEDGTITIQRTEVLESTRGNPSPTPAANPKRLARPQEF